MAYSSAKGRKPFERASKIAHAEIINNPEVDAFLKSCTLPHVPQTVGLPLPVRPVKPVDAGGIRAIIAVDGGFTETYVREEYPSASITFFTFGPLLLPMPALRDLDRKRFIAPEDLQALKNLQRYTFTLPTRGVRPSIDPSLATAVRRSIYEFFARQNASGEEPLLRTLRWFLFREWQEPPDASRVEDLAHCPNPDCSGGGIQFRVDQPAETVCPGCGIPIYLTDVFRLHELVDEEQGAGRVQIYLMTLLEQMVLLHVMRIIWSIKRSLLAEVLLIKDGPLAFFGQVAPMYRPMRDLTRFLMEQQALAGQGLQSYLYLAGVEKSGAFVDHAAAIEARLKPGSYVLPDNDYIYRYIVPGDPATGIYGRNTYYGGKVIYKSQAGDMHVLTVPNVEPASNPRPEDFPNLDMVLHLVGELRCSMYENALLPVALANKLVSISDFPSQRILAAFAKQSVG